MIALIIVLILVVITAVGSFFAVRASRVYHDLNRYAQSDEARVRWNVAYSDRFFWTTVAVIAGVLLVATLLVSWLWPAGITYGETNEAKVLAQNVAIAEKRRDNYTNIVSETLKSYPGYEKGVFDGVRPEVLLNFPNIKTNEVLVQQVKYILDANEKVYELQEQLAAKRQAIRANSHNPWIFHAIWFPSEQAP